MSEDVSLQGLSIPEQAVKFLRRATDMEAQNRQSALDDLRFAYGDQWPAQMQNARHLESRPWFVINETDAFIRQICNQQRQQRPRIKVHGVNTRADSKIAEVITGICRHIEELSDADNAYDTAFEFAVRMGWGYWRLSADYVSPKSFDQDIRIDTVPNPFSVYFDPDSHMPDGSDAKYCIITDMMPKEEFIRLYPDAELDNFSVRAAGDNTSEWMNKYNVRVAEFYRAEMKKSRLYRLSDGSVKWADEMPDAAVLDAVGVKVQGDRMSYKRQIKWHKVTATQVLEEREIPGIYIPVVPVYGANLQVDGRVRRFGVTRAAKDPQRMLNFWQTAITELIALAPKAKWIMAEGQDEGHENEWNQANVKALPYLVYKPTDVMGNPAPPPQRQVPEPPPEGAMAAASAAHDNLQRVLGMFDPAQQRSGNVSGKALQGEQQQSDMSNFHFYDNLTRSIKHTGRIILGWIPVYYGEKRVMRIIGDDGKPDTITINDRNAVGKVENDLTVGEYDVVMDTGPGYNSKRAEGAEMIGNMIKADPHLMATAGDLLFRNMDFPGADVIADRLAASNPLAQIDDKSDIPPQAQMMIKQLQAQLQQAGQQMQQMQMVDKFRVNVEATKQAAETHRDELREDREDRRLMQRDATKILDTHAKAQAQLGAKEIDGVIAILTQLKGQQHEKELAQLERIANQEEREEENENLRMQQ